MAPKEKAEKEREKKRLLKKRIEISNSMKNWKDSLEHNQEHNLHEHTDQHKLFPPPTTAPIETATPLKCAHVTSTTSTINALPDQEKVECDECIPNKAIVQYLCRERHARKDLEAKLFFFQYWKNGGETINIDHVPEKKEKQKQTRKNRKKKKKKNGWKFRGQKQKTLHHDHGSGYVDCIFWQRLFIF
jgi:hypothetical protein